MYEQIPTPAVIIDLTQTEKNLIKMAAGLKKNGIRLRPHIKPHKSIELAKLQLSLGACGITCAKLGEAEVMADGGVSDILIAFPLLGKDKMDRLAVLLKKADITVIANSWQGAKELSDTGVRAGKKIPLLIEVDGGIHRGGLAPGNPTVAFAKNIAGLPGITIKGLMYYGGTIYSEKEKRGFERVSAEGRDKLLQTAELLKKAGFSMEILSAGSSYSSKCPECLKGITEVRPGHYIFNDVGQLSTNMAAEEECSLRVAATVVSRVDAHHVIIDAGSKTLTTDVCLHHAGYGYVSGRPDILVEKLNEEHGFLYSPKDIGLEIGEKISIIPNHACVVPNLADEVFGFKNGFFDHMIKIDARGKNR